MSKNGTQYRHGKTVGYVVVMLPYGYVGKVCRGLAGTPRLLGSSLGTLFKTRREAQQMIDGPPSSDVRYSIVRVAHLAGANQ